MTATQSTYRIRISTARRKDFQELVRWIKAAGGKFDPNSKTWTVAADDIDTLLDNVSGSRMRQFYGGDYTIEAAH